MNQVEELIAQWRDKKISGTGLMRGLVSYAGWDVPVSEAAVGGALASNAAPSLQLSSDPDGAVCLLIFSSAETMTRYRNSIGAKGDQHFLSVRGTWVFHLTLDKVDKIWIDGGSAHDIFYGKEHFGALRDMAEAIKVEEALVGLRKGTAPDNAIQTAKGYKNYYLPVAVKDNKPSFIMAPDEQGRALAAAFTSDDTFDAFAPEAREMANGAEVQQMQIDGEALFDAFQRMSIDGFVFNCAGPIPPVAFQQAAAGIILEGKD